MRVLRRAVVVAVATAGLAAWGTGTAVAAPSMKVSFATYGTGSSAGWLAHKSGVSLTVGPSTSDYANIVFKRVSSTLPTTEPTFTTDNYNAGSPRWYIQFGQGDYLFGYPSNSNLNGSDFAWSVNGCSGVDPNTYVSYSTAVTEASACGTTVTGLFVVADGDQPGTTDTITDLHYDGYSF